MKPKAYRKTKPSKASDLVKFKANSAGGPIALVTNPPSAAGQTDGPCIRNVAPNQGNDVSPRE